MKHVFGLSACCGMLAVLLAGTARAENKTATTDPLAAETLLILKQNCLSCHNPEKHKGGLDLTARDRALKGGDSGAVIMAAKASESPLIHALAPDADPHMPPKGQLTPEEIGTLRRWIDAGLPWAELAEPAPTTRPIVLRAMPAAYQPVLAIALAADGKRLAIGRGDRAIVVDLAAKDAPVIAVCPSPNEPVYSLAWSPDGNVLAVGGYRNVRVWDLKSAGPIRTFDQLAGRITALAFSPDGRALLAADGEPGAEGFVRQWSISDATPPMSWVAHRDSIASLKLSPDGTRIATASADKLVKIWDRSERKELAVLEGHAQPVLAVSFNKDATRLASAGSDKEIKIWDTKTWELVTTLMPGPTGVGDMCWVDEKRLLAASDDGIVRLANQENKERAERSFAEAADIVYCVALSPDGKTAYAGCHDGKVYIWTIASGKLEGTIPAAQPPATAASGAEK